MSPGSGNKPASHVLAPYLPLLGLYVSGDLDNLTIYTTARGRIVWYPRTPPTKPPTDFQKRCRQRFKQAQRQWQLLDAFTKATWEVAMQRCSIDMTGQNAYISLALKPDDSALLTINRKAGTALTPPQPVPW